MANSLVKSRIVKISPPAAPASKLASKSGMAGLGLRGDRRSELSSGFTGLLARAPRTGGLPTHRRDIHDVYVNVKPGSKIFSALSGGCGERRFDLGQGAPPAPMRYFPGRPHTHRRNCTWPRLLEAGQS